MPNMNMVKSSSHRDNIFSLQLALFGVYWFNERFYKWMLIKKLDISEYSFKIRNKIVGQHDSESN
jgi:hypothetical protein